MATFRYTNPIDCIVSIMSLLICVFIIAGIAEAVESISKLPEGLALTIGVVSACAFLLITQTYRNTFSAWIYTRLILKTRISLKEAKSISNLFSVNGSGLWHPMKHIKQLSPEARRKALITAAERIRY